ncbi:hypothetical protein ABT282_30880 [Streptomyces sp. NPDC000927]
MIDTTTEQPLTWSEIVLDELQRTANDLSQADEALRRIQGDAR